MSKKPIIALVVFALVIVFIGWYFSDIFTYFVISMVLATILKPIVNFISKKLLVPKALSILLAKGFLIAIVVLLASTFTPLISEQIELIGSIDVDRVINFVQVPMMSVHDWMLEMNIIPEDSGGFEDTLKTYLVDFAGTINIKGLFNTLFSLTGSLFVSILAISFITFFLTYNPGMVKNQLLKLIPNQYFEISVAALNKIEYLLGRYFRGVLIQMVSIFSISSIGLTIVGVEYAITIALFAALVNIIPYIGPLFGALFGMIIGLTTSNVEFGSSEFYFQLIEISSVFGVVQIIDNVALQPIIFSKSLKAHPLEIFVIIFAGANIGGPVGMVLAIPIYTIVKVSITELLRGYKQYRIFNKTSSSAT